MKIKYIRILILAMSAMMTGLTYTTAYAHEGFVWDSSKGTVKVGNECLHTTRWKKEMGACPGAPKVEKKKAKAAPKDSDRDGVVDSQDQCPDTPYGTKVDSRGCAIVEKITINAVNFDFDKATLKDSARAILDDAADKLANKNIKSITVTGHTDSTGPDAYNQGLSERRAKAVKAYLEGKGIGSITAAGKGESSPVADNSTRDGRAKNRRVEIDVKL